MNKIYKVVWSKVKNCYVVVSEVAKANGKSGVKTIAAVTAAAILVSGGTALAADYTIGGTYDSISSFKTDTGFNALTDKKWYCNYYPVNDKPGEANHVTTDAAIDYTTTEANGNIGILASYVGNKGTTDQKTDNPNNNTLTIKHDVTINTNGTLNLYASCIDGGADASYDSVATGNTLSIEGVTLTAGGHTFIGGALSNDGSNADVDSNTAILKDVDVKLADGSYLCVYGGEARGGSATNNEAIIENVTVENAELYGGFARLKGGDASGNTITLTDATIGEGSTIAGGHVYNAAGNADDNTVNIEGGSKISGSVYAGIATNDTANDNVINISGNADISNASLYGDDGGEGTGNTLNLKEGWTGKTVGAAENFNEINVEKGVEATFKEAINATEDLNVNVMEGAVMNAQVTTADTGSSNVDVSGGTWNVTDDSTVNTLSGKDGLIQKDASADAVALDVVGNDDSNVLIKDSTLEFKGIDLTLTSDYQGKKGNVNEGVIYNTTIKSDGKVTLNETGKTNPVLGTGTNTVEAAEVEITTASDKAVTGYGINTVTADKITVNAPVDGIFVPKDSGAGKVVMNGFDEMTINAGEHAIVNNSINATDTTLVIEGNEDSVLNLNSDGARPTIAAKTGANKTDISAGTVNVNGSSDHKYNAVVYAADGAQLTITATNTNAETGGINITNEGTASTGAAVLAKAAADTTEVTLNGNIDIDANGGRGINAKNGTAVDVAGAAVINVGDETTKAININNAGYGLIAQYNGTQINVKGDALNIDGGGAADSNGIWVMNGNLTDTDSSDNAKITIDKGTTTTITNVDSAIMGTSQGTVDIAGDLYATAKDEVIGARGGSTINVNSAGDENVTVQMKGDIVYELDSKDIHPVDATVVVNLANSDSWFEGNIYKNDVAIDAGSPTGDVGGMNLGLANGAQWTTKDSGTSFVNDLTMDGGIINQNSTDEITIDNLAGEGNVVFKSESGQINVMAADGATLNMSMAGEDADSLSTTEDLNTLANKLDVAEDATANVTGKIHVDEGLINGAIDMTVEYEDIDGDKLLNGVIKDVQHSASTTALNIGNIATNAAVAWRDEDATLSQRLGELRESEGGQGVWARMTQGEFERGSDFETEYNTLQIGYDKAKGDWHYGAAVSHSEGDTVYGAGSGEIDSTSLSVYGTWLGDKGHYKDIVAKIGVINNEYTINAANQLTKGDYDTVGTSISGEYGMKQDLGSGWYVNPLAKMTYMHIGSADYTTNNGINVKHKSVDSLIARLGAELGKQIGEKGDIYIKASALHDFGGDADTILRRDANSAFINDEIGGTWYEIGLGFNYKTSDATYLYADIIKTYGDEIRTPWQWNAGVRYSF